MARAPRTVKLKLVGAGVKREKSHVVMKKRLQIGMVEVEAPEYESGEEIRCLGESRP